MAFCNDTFRTGLDRSKDIRVKAERGCVLQCLEDMPHSCLCFHEELTEETSADMLYDSCSCSFSSALTWMLYILNWFALHV